MARPAAAVLDDALQLSEAEREDLGWALLDSVHGAKNQGDGDVDDAWAEEIRRRVEELRCGRAWMVAWADVEAELRAKFPGG